MKIYLNGKLVSKDKAKISVFDRGLFYGDGIFESLRTYNGKPLMLDEHLKRLYRSAKYIGIKVPSLKNAVLKTIKANKYKESYIKVLVTRGEVSGHGLDPKNVSSKPTILVIVTKLKDNKKYLKGWKAIITNVKRRDTIANIKSLNYLNNILAILEANKRKADEAIFTTEKGHLAEGTVSNIFFVKRNVLYTPSLKTGILNGITRLKIIKLARKLEIKVFEGLYNKKELYAADECFLTSSGPGIIPIVKIDNKKIGNGKPGKITKNLTKEYNKTTGY